MVAKRFAITGKFSTGGDCTNSVGGKLPPELNAIMYFIELESQEGE
jgi:hypothetical protein